MTLTNGTECPWVPVLAYEPPDRFVFSWNISPYWQLEPDADKQSEVEVTFTALEGRPHARGHRPPAPRPARRRLDGRPPGVSTGEGWPLYLRRYADLLDR
jgi:uncharacterized protein YndB with AHSA1/START domain